MGDHESPYVEKQQCCMKIFHIWSDFRLRDIFLTQRPFNLFDKDSRNMPKQCSRNAHCPRKHSNMTMSAALYALAKFLPIHVCG